MAESVVPRPFDKLSNTLLSMTTTDKMSPENGSTEDVQNVTQGSLLRDDCIRVVFSEMEFFPWDNPDNIVSEEVETIVRRFKNNLLALLFLIGVPANVINMAVFYKQGLKDRVNLCLFCLSLADALYLTNVMLYHGEQLHLQFTTGEQFGPIAVFMINNNLIIGIGFCYVSPVLSAIIATERCLCVFNPLKFQTLLRTRTMAAMIIVSSIVVFGLYFFVSFRYHIGCIYDPSTGVVLTTPVDGEFYKAHKDFIDSLDSLIFGVGMPGVEMTVVVTATVLTIIKLRQIVAWRSETTSTISSREVALTKMLVGSSLLFIFCFTPIALIPFSWLFLPEANSGRRQQNFFLCGVWVSELFTYINATFNMFVYYLMGSRYRQTLWTLLGRGKERVSKE